jgi:uncharacterized membrane protein YkvA (DUF1232 family)
MMSHMASRARTILKPWVWLTLLRVGFKSLFNRNVPWYAKALVILAVIYAIMPFDIIADIAPVIGWADDAAIVLGLLSLALSLTPAGVVDDNPMQPTAGPDMDPSAERGPGRTVVTQEPAGRLAAGGSDKKG